MTLDTILRLLNTVANYGTLFALGALGWRDRARTRAVNRVLSRVDARDENNL